MEIIIKRYDSADDWTRGVMYINGVFECYTLEDEERDVKVWGDTCIPYGTYEVNLRREGRFHNSYKNKFSFHNGMLHVINVPNFKYILIHIGNFTKDTAGCLLVGEGVTKNGVLQGSTNAYKKMYPKVLEAFNNDEKVTIKYEKL